MPEPVFYEHCDDPSCDLGFVEYDCPACQRRQSDYAELWSCRFDAYAGRPLEFDCPDCRAALVMRLDAEEFLEVACRA